MSWLVNIDHVTYCCAKGMLEKWAWFHIEVEGGTMVTRIDDVDPENPDSSMRLWCIDYGRFGVALVEGIDRARKSQVTRFVERHGDHSIQHVAYESRNLTGLRDRLERYACLPLGEVVAKRDYLGTLQQFFCRGYSALPAAENAFAEYVQRPRSAQEEYEISFSSKAGKAFYRQIEEAMESREILPFTQFEAMPADWRPPEVQRPPRAERPHGSVA